MNDYPKIKVTLLYAFIGSGIGGLLAGISFMPHLSMLLLALIFGIVLGFVPAFITGLILAILQTTKDNPKSYFFNGYCWWFGIIILFFNIKSI